MRAARAEPRDRVAPHGDVGVAPLAEDAQEDAHSRVRDEITDTVHLKVVGEDVGGPAEVCLAINLELVETGHPVAAADALGSRHLHDGALGQPVVLVPRVKEVDEGEGVAPRQPSERLAVHARLGEERGQREAVYDRSGSAGPQRQAGRAGGERAGEE